MIKLMHCGWCVGGLLFVMIAWTPLYAYNLFFSAQNSAELSGSDGINISLIDSLKTSLTGMSKTQYLLYQNDFAYSGGSFSIGAPTLQTQFKLGGFSLLSEHAFNPLDRLSASSGFIKLSSSHLTLTSGDTAVYAPDDTSIGLQDGVVLETDLPVNLMVYGGINDAGNTVGLWNGLDNLPFFTRLETTFLEQRSNTVNANLRYLGLLGKQELSDAIYFEESAVFGRIGPQYRAKAYFEYLLSSSEEDYHTLYNSYSYWYNTPDNEWNGTTGEEFITYWQYKTMSVLRYLSNLLFSYKYSRRVDLANLIGHRYSVSDLIQFFEWPKLSITYGKDIYYCSSEDDPVDQIADTYQLSMSDTYTAWSWLLGYSFENTKDYLDEDNNSIEYGYAANLSRYFTIGTLSLGYTFDRDYTPAQMTFIDTVEYQSAINVPLISGWDIYSTWKKNLGASETQELTYGLKYSYDEDNYLTFDQTWRDGLLYSSAFHFEYQLDNLSYLRWDILNTEENEEKPESLMTEGRVTGVAFLDGNANGVMDPDEVGLANIPMLINGPEGRKIKSGEDGSFTFSEAYNKYIKSYSISIEANMADMTLKYAPLSYEPLPILFTQEKRDIVINFPVVRTYGIKGEVFLDDNENGVFDPDSDLPVPWARVIIDGGVNITYINGNGQFVFRNIPAGKHTLEISPYGFPAGFSFTTPSRIEVELGENKSEEQYRFGVWYPSIGKQKIKKQKF